MGESKRKEPLMASVKYDYAEMIWNEVRDAAAQDRVALLPVATYEDHGPHLPVDVDVVLATEICRRTAARIPEEVVLAPPVTHGYSPHHMDFHGDDHHPVGHLHQLCPGRMLQPGLSRISSVSSSSTATGATPRRSTWPPVCTVLDYGRTCSVRQRQPLGTKAGPRETGNALRDSDYGGTSHGGEYETSLYLVLKPDLVEMDKAVDNRSPLPDSFKTDLLSGGHPEASDARLVPYWSSISPSGVMGDATKATKEKGEKFLEAAINGVIELIRELRKTPILARRVQHGDVPDTKWKMT